MKLKMIVILCAFCCNARLVQAEIVNPQVNPQTEVLAEPTHVHYLTYDEAVQIALHDNFDLLVIRNQEESFKLRSAQALSPQNPIFTYSKSDIPGLSLSEQSAQVTYQVAWTIGFPGKALSQSAAVRHQAEAASQQAVAQEINIMTALSNNFVSFAVNNAFYKFLLQEQKRDHELMKLLEKRFSASQAAKVDLLNAQVTTQQIAQSILQNRNDYEVLLTQFRQIIRKPEDNTLRPQFPEEIVVPSVKQSYEELIRIMMRNNQALNASRKLVESSDALVTNASLQPFPDFQLTAAVNKWTSQAAPNGPDVLRDYSVGLGLAIPIFFPFNELTGMHAAQHDRIVTENQYNSQQLQMISSLQTLYTSLKATLKDLEASEKLVVPAAKASFDLTLLTYGMGKADYFAVNQSRTILHGAMKDMLTKRQNIAQFYNQLIAQMGCDIGKTEGPNVCK